VTDSLYSGIISGDGNDNSGDYSAIGAGYQNTIVSGLSINARHNFIGSGYQNTINTTNGILWGGFIGSGINNSLVSYGFSGQSAIVGGTFNTINETASLGGSQSPSFIGGGGSNEILQTRYGAICGGQLNVIKTSNYSFIGGGYTNSISTGIRNTISGGYENIVTGNNSTIGGGFQNEVSSANSSIQGGAYAIADRATMRSYSGSKFGATNGSAQQVDFVLNNNTTNATATNLFLDGSSARLTIPSGKSLSATINVSGISSTGAEACHYVRKVMIKNVGGTTSLVGAVSTIGTDVETSAGLDVTITADNTNDALDIKVTGLAATDMNWVCHVSGVEIAYAA